MIQTKIISPLEKSRYSRQIDMPEWTIDAQIKLKQSSVLIIGAGGLGSPAALYLAAAGIGNLGIADGDRVDISNLQRQIAHTTSRIGILKADSAARTVAELNPEVEIGVIPHFLDSNNIEETIAPYDFVIDATDSFTAKRLINDACIRASKPLSHGAIWRMQGHTITILPSTACYSCLFPTDPQPDATQPRGPLGSVAGIIGTIQATEAIKYITGIGSLLTNTLLQFDAAEMSFRRINVSIDPQCHNIHKPAPPTKH